MLDFSHIPERTIANTQIFTGNSPTFGEVWQTWTKPRGVTMCSILLQGKGGNGGTSAPGAATAIAGAGGGSSGNMCHLIVPVSHLPDTLYLTLAGYGSASGVVSAIQISPNTAVEGRLASCAGGNNGGNSSGATRGTGGTAPTIATNLTMPLGWPYTQFVVAGQAGTNGGASQAAGSNLTIPVTGAIATGGTGGGGIDSATGTSGLVGGSFTITAGADFPAHAGGTAGTTTAMVPGAGKNGYKLPDKLFFYGGTGAGSSYNAATGAGLVQSPAGAGGYGSGGGGLAASQTGSVAQPAALGGPALCIITCW